MFIALKNEKIIAYNKTGSFPCLVFDRIDEMKDCDLVEIGGEFVTVDDPRAIEKAKKSEIERLKQELNETDYKIIKCSECSLAGVELPYDIAELHAKRQALRDRINELEG